MSWRNLQVVAALLALGAGIGYLYAQDRGGSGTLTAQDRLDIQELYWSYAHGHDFRDAELVASTFADDAVLQTLPGSALTGKDAIAESYARRFADGSFDSGWRHWQNAWRITPTPEGALGRVYWVALEVGTGDSRARSPTGGRGQGPAIHQHRILRRRLREDRRRVALQEPRAELGRDALGVRGKRAAVSGTGVGGSR